MTTTASLCEHFVNDITISNWKYWNITSVNRNSHISETGSETRCFARVSFSYFVDVIRCAVYLMSENLWNVYIENSTFTDVISSPLFCKDSISNRIYALFINLQVRCVSVFSLFKLKNRSNNVCDSCFTAMMAYLLKVTINWYQCKNIYNFCNKMKNNISTMSDQFHNINVLISVTSMLQNSLILERGKR